MKLMNRLQENNEKFEKNAKSGKYFIGLGSNTRARHFSKTPYT